MMLASIAVNYVAGVFIEDHLERFSGRVALALGIMANLGLLCYFKYASFLVDNLHTLLGVFLPARSVPHWQLGAVHLPVGISFLPFMPSPI